MSSAFPASLVSHIYFLFLSTIPRTCPCPLPSSLHTLYNSFPHPGSFPFTCENPYVSSASQMSPFPMMLFQSETSPSSELPGDVFIPFLVSLTPVVWVLVWGSCVVGEDCQRFKSSLCYPPCDLRPVTYSLVCRFGIEPPASQGDLKV